MMAARKLQLVPTGMSQLQCCCCSMYSSDTLYRSVPQFKSALVLSGSRVGSHECGVRSKGRVQATASIGYSLKSHASP
jgi:hypothetical protein